MPSKFSYTVDDDTFHVRLYTTDQEQPFVFQPNYPDNTPWESKEAAAAWAEQCIYDLENPPAPPASPEQEGQG
jgi:hypothetical protein